MRNIYTNQTRPGDTIQSGSRENGFPTIGAEIGMSIYDSLEGHVYHIDTIEPKDNRKFCEGLKLPLGRHKWQSRTRAMEMTKQYLTDQGLKLGVDFRFTVSRHIEPIVQFSAEHEEFKTMLALKWSASVG